MNPSNPLISVIIPSYNREVLILKAIKSVMDQTLQDFEILVIDDASTDNTARVIKDLNNEKIRYFCMEKNGGQCIARNFGMRQAKGTYVAFLDSDDEWLPRKLELQLACFEKGPVNPAAVYGYAFKADMIRDETLLIEEPYYRGNIYDKFLEGFCPPTPSLFMVRKDAILEMNGFDEKLITFVDLDMWLRIAQKYAFDYADEPVIIKYEQIGDQYVNNFEKRYNGYFLFFKKWEEEIIRKKGKEGLLKLRTEMAYALITPFMSHPPANLRRHIPKLIGLMISIRSTRWRYYLKSLLIGILGPNIIYYLRKKIN
jgi:glycosyltransferase involved in cell wall biosynthesis